MPVVRLNNKLCHFAHIPKCGGTSVEEYLKDIGAELAFFDPDFITKPARQTWNKSSPQHIDGYSLSRLFPAAFFDFSFAVARNPFARFESAFKHQMQKRKSLRESMDINKFVQKELKVAAQTLGIYDNHFLPQVNFLMPNTTYKVFKLENGLERVKKYIDIKFLENWSPSKIACLNTGRKDIMLELSDESREIVSTIYRNDFKKFGYELTPN